MKILYLNFSLTVGGIERLLVDIANLACKNKENEIYVCIINRNYDMDLIKELDSRVKVILLNREEGTAKFKYILKLAKIIFKNKINVIHCQCQNTVKFSILSKIIMPKLKIFTTVHDTKIYTNIKKYEVIIDRVFCRKIIAISEIVKSEILSTGMPGKKVVRIYNAINVDKFRNYEKNILKDDGIIVGNVARLMPDKKGQDVLIKAIAKVKDTYPNIKCLLAGEPPIGEEENIKMLSEICKEYGVEKEVFILGNIKNVPKLLKHLDVFIMPSRFEGFGISLIEAMAAGVPCIASDIDGPKEIIKDNEYGLLFRSEDYNDLAEKICLTIQKMDKINKKRIQNYVDSNFNIVNMLDKLITLYES